MTLLAPCFECLGLVSPGRIEPCLLVRELVCHADDCLHISLSQACTTATFLQGSWRIAKTDQHAKAHASKDLLVSVSHTMTRRFSFVLDSTSI